MYTKVKIVFAVLIGIALLSAIAARPASQENENAGREITHVHKTGGGGGGGGERGSSDEHVHTHHRHHHDGGGNDGNHIHHTRGETITNVHKINGGENGGGGDDVGQGVNTVPHEGSVGDRADLTSGINTVPHEVGGGKPKKTIQPPPKYGSFINDGKSFLANTDVPRREICNRGLVDRTATKLRNGLVNGVNNLQGGIEQLTQGGNILGPIGGLVNDAGKGVRNLANNALDGVDFAIQDAACGLGNIADDAADGLGSGNLFSDVGDAVKEFFGGLGNIAEDVGSEAAEGVGRAASNIKSALSNFDGERKTHYEKSSP